MFHSIKNAPRRSALRRKRSMSLKRPAAGGESRKRDSLFYFGRNDGTNEKTGFYIIKDIIEKKEQSGKPCDILHIVKWADNRESVFLIRDIKCFYHIIHNWI